MDECGIDKSKWVPSRRWEQMAIIAVLSLLIALVVGVGAPDTFGIPALVTIAVSIVILAAYGLRASMLENARQRLRQRLARK